MPQRIFKSIRVRLTLSYLLVFGLVQTAACILIVYQRERSASVEFDRNLEEQARSMANVIEIAADGNLTRFDIQKVRQYAKAFGYADFYYEVRTADRELLEKSANLRDHDLEEYLPEQEVLRKQFQTIQQVSGETIDKILGVGGELRLLSYYHIPRNGSPYIMQVALNVQKLHAFNWQLRDSFIRISLLALLAAGLTSWLLSRRSLRPIETIKNQVSDIHVDELSHGIDVEQAGSELFALTNSVNDMLARLDRSFSAQSDFLNHAAHELKTPLAVMLGETQRLRRAPRTVEDYEKNLREMEQQLLRLAKVVDSLLMLAKARAGTRDLDEAPVSANDFVTEALERCQPIARHRQIRLDASLAYDAESDMEPIVLGDERLLIAMIENLVRNSIRLSAVGSMVRVAVSIVESNVIIAVQDEGPGISDAQMDNLFKAFVSAPMAGRSSGGTGIGLAIVNSVVKLHRGEINVANRVTGGAEFVISLPLQVANEEPLDTDLS